MPFNLMDFITQVANQNQQSAQTQPVEAPVAQAPQAPLMSPEQMVGQPGQNAMAGGSSPFAQLMGGGEEKDHKGLFSTLLKLFAGG